MMFQVLAVVMEPRITLATTNTVLAASESMTALKNAVRMERMLLRDHTIYAAETITPLGLIN
jgi:hypothetical protein